MRTLMFWLARALAVIGGLVLVGLILLTCVSVAGRIGNGFGHSPWLLARAPGLAAWFQGVGPVNGDFEVVESGIAVAIMCFFPWCFVNRGHASVDIFTNVLPEVLNRLLTLLWDLVFVAIMALLTWRLYEGTVNKYDYAETTYLIEFPLWWSYAATTIAAAFSTLAALYAAWSSFRVLIGRDEVPLGGIRVDH